MTVRDWLESRQEERRERRRRMYAERARDAVQIREFGGVIYLSYNDVPLVPVDMLDKDVTEALERARKAYVEYFAAKYNGQ